ncbi:MAG: choice-of-anchor B family protein [Gemmatimonadota bacterium]|nr:choice-of-anchor B family protein [Gemmatimonadota bacterium]
MRYPHLPRPVPALAAASIALAAAPLPASRAGLAAQNFGGSLAIGDGHVLVGEPANRQLPGIVYVYGHASEGWAETARLALSPAPAPPDGFGRALAADDDLVLVGAPALEAAVFFQRDAQGEWRETGRLAPETAGGGTGFGSAVALDGDIAVVAAPDEDEGAGAVHVFARDGGAWTRRGRFRPEAGARAFGTVIALDGTSLLVSAAPATDTSVAGVHALRLDRASGELEPLGLLEPAAELGGRSMFGSVLALEGDLALVGAPMAKGAGRVLVFEREGAAGAWRRAGTLAAFDGEDRFRFGSAIAFDGGDAWIGAPGSGGGSGGLYRFVSDGAGGWSRVVKSGPEGLADRAAFGSSLALAGGVAAVGTGGIDRGAGGAVLRKRGADGDWTGGDLVTGDHRGLPAITGRDEEVRCTDNLAAGFECDNVNVLSFLPIGDLAGGRGSMVNDVWGWTDPETGREIAIVGRSDGTAFVDLSDPLNPVLLGDLPKTPGSRSSVWRDMKVHRDHAYVVADGAERHGVQVFDLRRLRDVEGESAVFEPDFLYDGVASAHNIVINEDEGFAYVVGSSGGGETCGGGLHMLDLSDPVRPVFAGCFADARTGRRGTGYSHDAQCVTYRGPDEDYRGREICIGSNETALSIADVSDKGNPVAVATASYPHVAYAHQGWLTEDHRHFYMNDEGDEGSGSVAGTRTLIWDVEDLDDPILAAQYVAETPDTDHNLYIRGNLMYQSNYGAGLRILDIANRTEPVEIASFGISPFGSSWSNYPYFESGAVVMTSMSDGIFIVRNTGRRKLIP